MLLHRAVMAYTTADTDLSCEDGIYRDAFISRKGNIIDLIDMTRAVQKINKAVRHFIPVELITSLRKITIAFQCTLCLAGLLPCRAVPPVVDGRTFRRIKAVPLSREHPLCSRLLDENVFDPQ